MEFIWSAFLVTAVALGLLGVVLVRRKGKNEHVFRFVGGQLLLLAAATGLFPFLLRAVGPLVWACMYVGVVVVFTVAVTWSAVRRAREQRARA